MEVNLIGRVRHTPLAPAKVLNPLFEAVVNSIDAIEDAELGIEKGRITVAVLREAPALPLVEEGTSEQVVPDLITGFEIFDNGIGFTEVNYHSFNEVDSPHKLSRGGKGLGRFLWLKAFERAEIESIFSEGEGFFRRTFVFSLETPNGISEHTVEPLGVSAELGTRVRLVGLREPYNTHVPARAETIATRIVEHCLEYFVLERMPPIQLSDEANEQNIDLNEIYSAMAAGNSTTDLQLRESQLRIIHFLLDARASVGHRVSFCAHKRVVKSVPLRSRIPHLPSSIQIDGEENTLLYAAYVSSEYLDNRVNQERTDFDFFEEDGLQFRGELSLKDIEEAVVEASQGFLEPFTKDVREDVVRKTERYVQEEAPQYRHLLNREPDIINQIPPDPSEEQIDNTLYLAARRLEERVRNEADQMLHENLISANGDLDEEKWDEFVNAWLDENEVGKATLAKYIMHRKRMLEFLERSLGIQPETGRFALEEVIHKIIFPLRTTSDEITYDDHNLWILDEKLAYHEYLASDRQLRAVNVLDSTSSQRPDLLIFHGPVAVVDEDPPYHSGIVIFEFKRPERDDYTDEENPIVQVYDYIAEIKEGRVRDRTGRRVRVPDTVPFYCYIVCDITPKLEKQATYAGTFTRTPDEGGYFGYNEDLGAYIEIISFDKLLIDAKKRNRVLFDKLNLPARIARNIEGIEQ